MASLVDNINSAFDSLENRVHSAYSTIEEMGGDSYTLSDQVTGNLVGAIRTIPNKPGLSADDLSNWISSDYIIEPGELAITYLDHGFTVRSGQNTTYNDALPLMTESIFKCWTNSQYATEDPIQFFGPIRFTPSKIGIVSSHMFIDQIGIRMDGVLSNPDSTISSDSLRLILRDGNGNEIDRTGVEKVCSESGNRSRNEFHYFHFTRRPFIVLSDSYRIDVVDQNDNGGYMVPYVIHQEEYDPEDYLYVDHSDKEHDDQPVVEIYSYNGNGYVIDKVVQERVDIIARQLGMMMVDTIRQDRFVQETIADAVDGYMDEQLNIQGGGSTD